MKPFCRILLLYIYLLLSIGLNAQVLTDFNATINVYSVTGSTPNYTIQGIVNNTTGQYSAANVAIGDIIYMSEAATCVRFQVTSVTAFGSAISATVTDINGITAAFPLGIGMILRETENFSFPLYVDGVADDLLACVRTHFTELVDQMPDADTDTIFYSLNSTVTRVLRNDTIPLPSFIDTTYSSGDTLFIVSGGDTSTVVVTVADTDTDSIYTNQNGVVTLVNRGDTITLPIDTDTDTDSIYFDSAGVVTLALRGDTVTLPIIQDTDTDSLFAITDAGVILLNRGDTIPSLIEVDGDTTNELQNLSRSGDSVLIERGTGVDLSDLRDNTDTSGYNLSFVRSNDTLFITDGNGTLFAVLPADQVFDGDSSITNEIQVLTKSNDTIYLSGGGFVLDTDTDTDTDEQNLSRSGDSLLIERGSGVNLSDFRDNTDTSGYNLSLIIQNDSVIITDGSGTLKAALPPGTVDTDNDSIYFDDRTSVVLINRGDTITLPADLVFDGDSSVTNEIQQIDSAVLTGTTLTIYLQSGGSASVDLASIDTDTDTDEQNLSLVGDSLLIERGAGVDLSGYLDNTDDQNIDSVTFSGNILTVYIESGASASVDLSSISVVDTDSQSLSIVNDTLYISRGNFVTLNPYINTDTSGYNLTFEKVGDSLFIKDGAGTLSVYIPDSVGGFVLPTDSITFNNNESGPDEAELNWDQTIGFPVFGGVGGISIKLGQDNLWLCENQTGTQINKGTVVGVVGALGNSGKFLIAPFLADGNTDNDLLLGIAAEDIPNGTDGYVMHQGKIRQIDLTAYPQGSILYASPTDSGALTTTEPANGFQKFPIAFVVDSSANGTLGVRVKTGEALRDLHDVDVSAPGDRDLIAYDSALGYWVTVKDSIFDGDSSVTNELQTLSKSNDTIYLSSGGFIIDNNGIYSSGNNSQNAAVTSIGIATSLNFENNTLYIDGVNNRVGINESSPSRDFEVMGDFKIGTNGLRSVTGLAGPADRQSFSIGGDGVGYRFEIIDSLSGASTLRLNNPFTGGSMALSKGNTFIMFNGSASTWAFGDVTNDAALAAYSGGLRFFVNGSGATSMNLNSSGNLGIGTGTAALDQKLEVDGKFDLEDGNQNQHIGENAGTYITGGVTQNFLPTNSIFLGSYTKADADGQSNQIVIGYNAQGEGSNTIKIGNTDIAEAYIEGIYDSPTASASNVFVNSSGQLMRSTATISAFDTIYSVSDSIIFITPTPDTFIVTFDPQTDNWGSQVVQSDATLDGNGTSASNLKLAQQGATSGQVLKWTGATWSPSSDLVNDADASTTNELQSLSWSAGTNGNDQISLSNGGGTVTITDNVIDDDADSTNEIQSLTFVNDTLYLSHSNSVVIPDSFLSGGSVKTLVSEMVSSNTETLINVTYDAGDQTLDFVVNNDLSLYDNSTSSFLSSEVDADTLNELQGFVVTTGSNAASWILSDNTTTTDVRIIGGSNITIQDGPSIAFGQVEISAFDSSGYNKSFTLTGDTVRISDGDTSLFVILPPVVDSQALGWTQDTGLLTLDNSPPITIEVYDGVTRGLVPDSIDGRGAHYLDMDGSWKPLTDNDNQTLSLVDTNLYITGGNFVNLAPILDFVNAADGNGIFSSSNSFDTIRVTDVLINNTLNLIETPLNASEERPIIDLWYAGVDKVFMRTKYIADSSSNSQINISSDGRFDFYGVNSIVSQSTGSPTISFGASAININGGDFNVDANTLFVDESSNRVGIGTSSPFAALHVIGTTDVDGRLDLDVNNGSVHIGNLAGINDTTYSGSNTMVGNSSLFAMTEGDRNVALGVYAGALCVRPNGVAPNKNSERSVFLGAYSSPDTSGQENQIVIGFGADGNGSNSTTIGNSGTNLVVIKGIYNNTTALTGDLVRVTSDGTLQRQTSSIRYKTDIRDYTRGTDDLMKLRPVWYRSKVDDTQSDFAGFIAEELHDLGLTEFLAYDENGEPSSLGYERLSVLLTKVAQEQQAQIEGLKTELNSQKEIIQSLIQRIEALENK